MRGTPIDQLIVQITIVTGLAIAYAKAFGPYQTIISGWIIDAGRVVKRYRGLVNLGTGIVIATGFTVVAAGLTGQWGAIPAGVLAGVFASVEASRVHDAASDAAAVVDVTAQHVGAAAREAANDAQKAATP